MLLQLVCRAVMLMSGIGIAAQYDYSNPITCYICDAAANGSQCATPATDQYNQPKLNKTECIRGVCIKWTRYKQGVLMLERTCSSRLEMNINLIHGVCRNERDGNGYLCMCGKHLCNAVSRNRADLSTVISLLAALGLSLLFILSIR